MYSVFPLWCKNTYRPLESLISCFCALKVLVITCHFLYVDTEINKSYAAYILQKHTSQIQSSHIGAFDMIMPHGEIINLPYVLQDPISECESPMTCFFIFVIWCFPSVMQGTQTTASSRYLFAEICTFFRMYLARFLEECKNIPNVCLCFHLQLRREETLSSHDVRIHPPVPDLEIRAHIRYVRN